MANEEALTLDGLALNDGVTFGMVSLSAPPPRERQEWVGAADSEAQLLVRKPLHENRKITARVEVVQQATMDLAHDKLAQIVDKLAKASKYPDGVALTWTPAGGTRTVTFDVLAGEITDLPIDWQDGWLANAPTITVEMTAKPYWRGSETLTSTAAASAPVTTLEVTGVPGDVPALGRLIVTDSATQSRRHVEWGLEGPLTYNASTALLVDSDSFVTSGFAGTQTTRSGAYDPDATGNSVVSASLIGGQTVAVCGTGALSHVGAFRVKARVLASIGMQVRLSYRVGAGQGGTNDWVTVPTEATWMELDLGPVSISTVLAGTQSWTGTIEASHPSNGAGIYIDYLVLVPTSCGYGKARAVYAYSPGVVAAYDQFTSTTAGSALNGRAAPSGGSWATSGDATDFVFSDTLGGATVGEGLVRSTGTETNGRFAILGTTNYTDTQVDVRTRRAYIASGINESGLIARWVDANNHLKLVVSTSGTLSLVQVVSGSPTTLASTSVPAALNTFTRLRLVAFVSGRAIASLLDDSGTSVASIEASSTALATGGVLDDGKPGIWDHGVGAVGVSRNYDDFAVATPAAEPIALFSGRDMQIRYDDVIRQDSTGTYTGRPPSYRGSRFVVPVGTSRVLVKARRNDIDVATDANVTDALQIQVGYTPRGLAVPR